jgi:hypothetical protein
MYDAPILSSAAVDHQIRKCIAFDISLPYLITWADVE